MTVFISCSGSLSKNVGELLRSWLPDVIQGVKPWLYSEDIDKGVMWPDAVAKALATTVGVFCVTQENKDAPWLLFEAGGLSKGLEKARVCPLLIDLEDQDVKGPLAYFTFTRPNKEDMRKLLKTINDADPEKKLHDDQLQKSFNRLWPEFEKPFRDIQEQHKKDAKPAPRSVDDMVVEILKVTRELQRNSEEILQALPKKMTGPPGSGYSGYGGVTEALARLRLFEEKEETAAATAGAQRYLDRLLEKAKEKPPEKPPDEPT